MSDRAVLPGSVWIDAWGDQQTILDGPQIGLERWTRHRGRVYVGTRVYPTTGSAPEAEILAEWAVDDEIQLTLFGGK